MSPQAQIGRPWILTVAQGILGFLAVSLVGGLMIALQFPHDPEREGFAILLVAAVVALMIGQAVALAIRSPWSWIAVLVAQALVAAFIVINVLEPTDRRLLMFPGGIIVILLLPAVRRWFFSRTPSVTSSA